MYVIQTVESYAALLEAIRSIPVSTQRRRVFRGQRQDYGGKMLVSSARRPSARSLLRGMQVWLPAIDALNIAKRGGKAVKSAYASFTATGTSPAWPSGITSRLNDDLLYNTEVDHTGTEGSALMQHYGADSDFLDCSDALDTALWFSHHDFRSRDVETSAEDWHDRWFTLHHRFSWYERAVDGSGYIYVFDARPFENRLAHGDSVELASFDPGTRPSVQQAALLYGEPGTPFHGDLADHVVAAFTFNVPLAGLPEIIHQRRTGDVFPRPAQDPVYAYLLSLPFYAKDPSADTRLERMIDLPLYADEAADESNVDGIAPFITASRQIWPTWIFNQLLRCTPEEARRFGVDKALLSRAEACVPGGCTNRLTVVDLSLFPEFSDECPSNLFLEFSPLEVTGTPPGLPRDFILVHKARGNEEVALHRIDRTNELRALWLRKGMLRGTQGYRFQAFFGWTTSSFRAGPVLFLDGLSSDISPGANESRFLLRYTLSVCCSVRVGALHAKPLRLGNPPTYWEINTKNMISE